jgi:hypothetical protein
MQPTNTEPQALAVLRLELTPGALTLRPLAENEPAFDREQFRTALRQRWPKLALAGIARKLQVSEPGLRKVLDGSREPSLSFYHRLCVGLGAPLGSFWSGVQLDGGQRKS